MKVAAAPARIGHPHVGDADHSGGDTSYIAVVDKHHNMVILDPACTAGSVRVS